MKKLKILFIFLYLIVICFAENEKEKSQNEMEEVLKSNRDAVAHISTSMKHMEKHVKKLNETIKQLQSETKTSELVENGVDVILKESKVSKKTAKPCIAKKNAAMKELRSQIKQKKKECEVGYAETFKIMNKDLKALTKKGHEMADALSKSSVKCLLDYKNQENECLKCLVSNRLPIVQNVSQLMMDTMDLVENRKPKLETAIEEAVVCFDKIKRETGKREDEILHNFESCVFSYSEYENY